MGKRTRRSRKQDEGRRVLSRMVECAARVCGERRAVEFVVGIGLQPRFVQAGLSSLMGARQVRYPAPTAYTLGRRYRHRSLSSPRWSLIAWAGAFSRSESWTWKPYREGLTGGIVG